MQLHACEADLLGCSHHSLQLQTCEVDLLGYSHCSFVKHTLAGLLSQYKNETSLLLRLLSFASLVSILSLQEKLTPRRGVLGIPHLVRCVSPWIPAESPGKGGSARQQ